MEPQRQKANGLQGPMVIDRAISNVCSSRFRDFFLAAHGTSQHGSAPVELSFDQAVGKQTKRLMF